MYRQEKIKPYGEDGEKGQVVERMFDNIATNYDKLNHRLSWNIDKGWRRKAIGQLEQFHPQTMLDVATGTGDFAILAAKMLKPQHIVGADISEGMMAIGKEKVANLHLDQTISFRKEDSLNMSFADETFDAVTAAFGIRNFQDLDRGLSEMCRVLKYGGHLSIVELTTPVHFPIKQLFRVYSHTFLPTYASLISKDKAAYEYLTDTIEAFPQGEQMMIILQRAGFRKTYFKRLTFGICTLYLAEK
ncbi:MAG: bifunctional demethylmenaquinone methyltransferase/2-methoxy-6-polyprenyl-1,4-benzoquinol methylase UbiE [Prevotella sp.]|nr:bifunctional demethylmenaquinone methyltransferase/2-methoxy-6-polyprenyl-1,4-benzoquinol methylase UbiE [Prevotella sp.]MDD4534892.1 bifunctional demethylmenaquinone methyltransferase/2-methoxy-6-polyprenyl-1,4-benzoquinol methylase UbiE [Prevotella sp.]MDT3388855.1 bifunctional demethylmenaquinone methyltransferase/2-methoxy-6-polyprenyl-1,4-benzoquinol methylase UbiE [Bacteroidota bacterium]